MEPGALMTGLLNSLDLEAGTDELRDLAAATAWLRAQDATAAPVTRSQLALARKVRAAVRVALGDSRAEGGDLADAGAVPVSVQLSADGGLVVATGDGMTGHLGRVLAEAVALRTSGEWERLKPCALDSCRWIFYDRSKNRSGRWCSMAGCGNKAKTRAFRAKQV